jgi:photosystem II stability/assembly factor-like uncharacterized protein
MRKPFTWMTKILLAEGLLAWGGALIPCLMVIQAAPQAASPAATANPLAQLKYRFIGPVGNRADAVVGEPGNPLVIYAGAASGGIWKTEDGGANWKPIFDHEDVAAIGALAIAPSEHNIVWAGTGEPFIIRADYPMGDGIYKSTDSGRTWRHVGLEKTGHIARIVINPHDPNIVFACAVGQAYRPQEQRGIFRTVDGGKTWQRVLFVNQDTGCSDLAMSPHDPETLFAGMWQVAIRTWDLDSGGTGSGIYVSHDGGDTWKKLTGHGLPAADHPEGKIAVAVAPSNSERVYALVQDKSPMFYRSDDGGKSWKVVNQSHVIDERSPYYTRFAVSPNDENLIYFVSVRWSVSRDGGKTLAQHATAAGGDLHDVWVDPSNANRLMVADDEGVGISLNGGKSYQHVSLPIAQIYHVYADHQIPYFVYSNRQDGLSYRGPSNNLEGGSSFFGGTITAGDWKQIGGCESGFAIPDPDDSNIVWSGCYDGDLTRMDLRTGQARAVAPWPMATYGWAPADVKYRWNWTFPLAISPEDHNRVYAGSQYVHVTTDAGQSWQVISPDLTANDKRHQQNSGGISVDNLMTFDGSTLYAIAESPVKAGIIWTGSNDGQVCVTQDGGKHWANVTQNMPNLPPWGTVSNIEPSHFEAGTARVTVNFEQVGNYDAYIYKTKNYGRTWSLISATVPKSVNSSAHCVVEDPVRRGMLYLGTDNSVYVSWDDGAHWTSLRNNMPPAPVYWLTIQPTFNDLVVATYGRGIWILDDITPLRDWDRVQNQDVSLFKPRPAYRFRHFDATRTSEQGGHVIGKNPPYGADINFYLKQAAKTVKITIQGPKGETIRTLNVKQGGKPGLNRVWWDLKYDPSHTVKLRTPPPDALWVKPGAKGWRPVVNWVSKPNDGPVAAPGNFLVKLEANGKTLTQSLEVMPDPHSLGTVEDIAKEVGFELQLRDELSQAADMINHIEWTRKQVADLEKMLAANPQDSAALQAAKTFEQQAIALEGKLINVHLTGAREDAFRAPMQLYGRLANLLAELEGTVGNGGSSADLPPTDQEIAVNKILAQRLAEARISFETFTKSLTPAFNNYLKSSRLTVAIEP